MIFLKARWLLQPETYPLELVRKPEILPGNLDPLRGRENHIPKWSFLATGSADLAHHSHEWPSLAEKAILSRSSPRLERAPAAIVLRRINHEVQLGSPHLRQDLVVIRRSAGPAKTRWLWQGQRRGNICNPSGLVLLCRPPDAVFAVFC